MMPRDPNRIPEVLDLLRKAWEVNTDMRLGQLIVGAVGPSDPCPEVFYIEDDKMAEQLRKFVKRYKQTCP